MAERFAVAVPRGLRLRGGPSTSHPILMTMPYRHHVYALGSTQGDWVNVSTNYRGTRIEGWTSAKFLVKEQEDPAPAARPQRGRIDLTFDHLLKAFPDGNKAIMKGLSDTEYDILDRYGVNHNELRLCHFIAQAGHETAHFRTLKEFGGRSYFMKMYDKTGKRPHVAKMLGNTQTGDGALFHGRGIFQLTGRHNYQVMGERLGIDLIRNPDLAATPATSLEIACIYWDDRKLNVAADRDDINHITRRINGGYNGLSDRKEVYRRLQKII